MWIDRDWGKKGCRKPEKMFRNHIAGSRNNLRVYDTPFFPKEVVESQSLPSWRWSKPALSQTRANTCLKTAGLWTTSVLHLSVSIQKKCRTWHFFFFPFLFLDISLRNSGIFFKVSSHWMAPGTSFLFIFSFQTTKIKRNKQMTESFSKLSVLFFPLQGLMFHRYFAFFPFFQLQTFIFHRFQDRRTTTQTRPEREGRNATTKQKTTKSIKSKRLCFDLIDLVT